MGRTNIHCHYAGLQGSLRLIHLGTNGRPKGTPLEAIGNYGMRHYVRQYVKESYHYGINSEIGIKNQYTRSGSSLSQGKVYTDDWSTDGWNINHHPKEADGDNGLT